MAVRRICSVDGCTEPHAGRGYCAVHYQHWHRWGDPLHYAPPAQTGCNFPGCDRKFDSHGYCWGHADQLRAGVELHPIRHIRAKTTCSAEDCTNIARTRGMCGKHYQRWREEYGVAAGFRTCKVDACNEVHVAQGYCTKHYAHWRIHGDPTIIVHRRRKCDAYALNETYFDEITTEDQAYWLGFLVADGGIIRSGSKTYSLRLELAAIDGEHVARFSEAIGSAKPLATRSKGTGSIVAVIDSWRMVESLERLGVTTRKSLTAEPWDGPAHLMPHYWRGMFDGDGTIFKGRTTPGEHWCVGLVGSRACIDVYGVWASAISGATATPRPVTGGIWRWKVEGGQKPQRLAEALYGNATISLPRKQERAKTLLAIDYDAIRSAANAARRATMQDAWATGRHSRAKR